MITLFGRDFPAGRHLGEYDSTSYPTELRDLVGRRDEVARELLSLGAFDPDSRAEAIPGLHALLKKYPHPLVYETLINACLDAGRLDEAKGVAFAARQRRLECLSSDHPEIRAEIEGIREWDPAEIDRWGSPLE